MFDLTSNNFWAMLQKDLLSIFNKPGMEIQIILSVYAIAFAFALSLLIQRIVRRRFPPMSRYGWIATNVVPSLLSPLMVILALVIAGWILPALVNIHHRTIDAFVKVAMAWFAARLILLVAQRHFMAYFISSVMLILALLSVTNLLPATQESLNNISFETSTFRLSLLGAIKGMFTLVVLFWGAGVLGKSGEAWLRRLNLSFNARELSIKFLRITLYCIAGLLTLNEMGVNLTALTVFGGALGVGLGFGLQKITSNFVSGIILLFERSIQTGDLIEVSGEKGWVRQMAVRHTLIETSDGRELLIPNENFITGNVTSWTYSNTNGRIDIPLVVEYDSDAELVKKLMLEATKAFPDTLSDPAPACHLREFSDHGMKFILMFWVSDIKILNAVKSDVMLRIVGTFRKNKIAFATA